MAAPKPPTLKAEPISERDAVDGSTSYVLKTLFAGGVAGCVAKTAVAPLDRVKILFQASNMNFVKDRGSLKGTIRAVKRIYHSEGARGLYKGHSAMLLRIFPYAALQFMTFEQFKRILIPDKTKEFPLARLVCGSLADPLDLIRARMAFQVHKTRYTGPLQTARLMMSEGGVSSLYKGFLPTLYGIIPYAGISFYSYDTLKRIAKTSFPKLTLNENGDLWTPVQLGVGAVAGAVAQTSAYPYDVVRRRMQVEGMGRLLPVYSSTWHAFKDIYATEGLRGLFVGLSINYVKVVPAVSLSFFTYEIMKRHLNIR